MENGVLESLQLAAFTDGARNQNNDVLTFILFYLALVTIHNVFGMLICTIVCVAAKQKIRILEVKYPQIIE